MRLPYFEQIRKSFEWVEKRLLLPSSVLCLALFCLAVGYLEAVQKQKPPILVQTNNSVPVVSLEKTNSGGVVASKNGTTFYYPWCSGRNRIKLENERWFSNPEEASKYGLKPAKNCLGL
jgi:hypothetical protein